MHVPLEAIGALFNGGMTVAVFWLLGWMMGLWGSLFDM